jgi:hypothetical protein
MIIIIFSISRDILPCQEKMSPDILSIFVHIKKNLKIGEVLYTSQDKNSKIHKNGKSQPGNLYKSVRDILPVKHNRPVGNS